MIVKVTDPAEYGMADEAKPFLIERHDGECWSVPAWDEQNLPDLCGPFATHEEATAVLLTHRSLGLV